jgi:large subunit ribosomal protein L2
MGKRIIQRRRGRGTPAYRVRKRAFSISVSYPDLSPDQTVRGEIIDILHNVAHNAPLAKIKANIDGKEIFFYNIAAFSCYTGQHIEIGKNASISPGNIVYLANVPPGTDVFNIEIIPGGNGKLARASSAKVVKREGDKVIVLLPSKKEVALPLYAKATVGIPAGIGRVEKPFVKAGNKWHKMKAKGKLYPRTSAVKMNVVNHPFGSGRGKHIKPKIAHWNAPPGAKVGLIRPRRTGRKK